MIVRFLSNQFLKRLEIFFDFFFKHLFSHIFPSTISFHLAAGMMSQTKRARIDGNSSDPESDIEAEYASQKAFKHSLLHISIKLKKKCADLLEYLKFLTDRVQKQLSKLLKRHHGLKFWLVIEVEYSAADKEDKKVTGYLRSRASVVHDSITLSEGVQSQVKEMEIKNANFMRQQSGLTLSAITSATLCASKHQPLLGAMHAPLPVFVAKSMSVVNVQNEDNRCFGYALISALHPAERNPGRARQYDRFFAEHGLDQIEYPVEPAAIPQLEDRLQINLNVFMFFDDEGKGKYPFYVSRKHFPVSIDLLHWAGHYAWIKNFERFLSSITKHNGRKFFCKRCLGHFSSEAVLEEHQTLCGREDFSSQIFTLPPPGSLIKFKNTRYQLRLPFVIYADFESLTPAPENDQENVAPAAGHGRKTFAFQKHIPCSVGLKLVSELPEVQHLHFEQHSGPDVSIWFLRKLLAYQDILTHILFDDQRLIMTAIDWIVFNDSVRCSICARMFDPEKNDKVRDHDHFTGKFRGAAHARCNLQLRKSYKIPVFFHNFRGYDSHLIVFALSQFPDIPIHVIGQGMEKYLTLSWGEHIVFKDSLQFLACSLEQLAVNLLKSGPDQFIQLKKEFGDDTDEKREQLRLILRKGVYPYDHMGSWDKFATSHLPSIEEFSSKLRFSECAPADYEHAKRVWDAFHCQSMQDYHDLYLKTDVLLLADIFESFRSVCLSNYGLDPAHYVSAPQLSWDGMLKHTACELQLISDPEMFRMIDPNIRGGITMICKRYARANNKYLGPEYFDPSKQNSFIMYLDANNLYGWAMSRSLPISGFHWVPEDVFLQIDWAAQTEEQDTGYIVECDLDYPQELHELHNDYPLAAERLNIQIEQLSDTQVRIRRNYRIPNLQENTKLVPNLMPKTKYGCHYLLLKFYLEHGMRLRKVHKVIAFKQQKWLAGYINQNSQLRAAAKNTFEQDFFKLMNNSVFGKTCENQKKRTDIQLVTTDQKRKTLTEKPHCLGFRIFDENLAAIDMRKIKVLIDKPFYVGFTVLELSKLHMYRFHYEVIKPKYGEKARLLFTDTDSLMYEIETEDLYADMSAQRDLFDFSNYPRTGPFFDNVNNKVIGKFKDETAGDPILEFVGLRPKMYSFLTVCNAHAGSAQLKEKHRAKGIQSAASKLLKHQDFLSQLNSPRENYVTNRRIGSKLHKVFRRL